jgi:hypothetical protein
MSHIWLKRASLSAVFLIVWAIGVNAQPSLSSPSNGATGVALPVSLSWAGDLFTSYVVQVSTSSSFTTTVSSQTIFMRNSASVGGLANNATYYWEVSATPLVGAASAWSSVWSFTTVIAAPVLSTPTNGAPQQPTTLSLSWNTVSDAATYNLQVSTSMNFTTMVSSQPGLSGLSASVGSLANGATYYWEVSAANAGGTSGWSSVWSFTTIALPGKPILSSPGDGAVTSTSPTLSWNPASGAATYNVQVSTAPAENGIFGSTVFSQSGITVLSLAISGLMYSTSTTTQNYYWMVQAVADPYMGPWSSVWGFKTTEVTGVPTLTSPTNNAMNQPASGLTLSWAANPNGGAVSSYAVQVSTGSAFSSTVYFGSNLTATSQILSTLLVGGTKYYWEVTATGLGGSATSTIDSFTVETAPGIPALASPTNGAPNQPVSGLTLSWAANTVGGGPVVSYNVRVSMSPGFGSTVFSQSGIKGTSQVVSGLASGTLNDLAEYYWEVSATNAVGASNWSSVWSFTTEVAPGAPALASPTNGAPNQPISRLTLSWASNSSGGEVSSYAVQVSTSSSFGTAFFSQSGITSGSSQVVSGLTEGTRYYWEVSAGNAVGESNWSSVWSFTTETAPGAPTLYAPANGASNQPISGLMLIWAANSSGSPATSYAVQVSTSSGFGTTFFSQSGITGISQVVSGLTNGKTYYWEVMATNAGGMGNWSSFWNFTTVSAMPGVPVISLPSNGAIGVALPVSLSWTAAPGAATYNVEVSTDPGFGSTVFSQSGITGISQVVNGLATDMSYYWEVSATNAGGTSAWVRASFTTTSTSVLQESAAKATGTDFAVKGAALVYSLNVAGPVGITFSDLLGRTALSMNRSLPAGHYTMALKDFSLAPGGYIVQFKAAGIQKREVVLIQR